MLLLEHIEYLCLYEAVDFVFYCRIEKRIYDISACRFDVFRLNEIVFVVFLFLAGALVKRNYCDGCTEELVIVFDPGEKHLLCTERLRFSSHRTRPSNTVPSPL